MKGAMNLIWSCRDNMTYSSQEMNLNITRLLMNDGSRFYDRLLSGDNKFHANIIEY